MLLLKNIIYTIFVAGTLVVLVPYWLLTRNAEAMPRHWGILQYLALLLALAGVAIYYQCVHVFANAGRGTPSPFDPPSILVVRGLYLFVRNPLYLGYLLLLLGEAAFFESWALLRYAAGFFVTVHLVVVMYEERTLRSTFGAPYDRYCRSVRRWMPGKKYQKTALHPGTPDAEKTGW
jgi:protein-S-isoprenylcysteine O-methyltransferase Ste14